MVLMHSYKLLHNPAYVGKDADNVNRVKLHLNDYDYIIIIKDS